MHYLTPLRLPPPNDSYQRLPNTNPPNHSNADTAVKKTERDVERAKAEANLATEKAKLNRDVDIARIQATRATEAQDEDLKKDVEMKRAAAELERLRATDVVKASIQRESKQQAADARAYEVQAEARAGYDKSTRTTDAAAYKTKADADAWSHAAVKNAEATLQKKLKEAEGLTAMANAYAQMSHAFGGPGGLLQYSKSSLPSFGYTYVIVLLVLGSAIRCKRGFPLEFQLASDSRDRTWGFRRRKVTNMPRSDDREGHVRRAS